MTTTKSQTTTLSGADVLPTRRFAMKAAPCGVSMEEVDPDARGFVYYLCSDIDPAVAALIARNAELVELRAALVAEVLTADAKADALAAENKALRDGMWKLADKIAIYADDDEIDSTRLGRLAHFWHGQLTALARNPAKGNDDG